MFKRTFVLNHPKFTSLARRISTSPMKGFDMGWEITFLTPVSHGDGRTWLDFQIRTITGGDHSPRFEASLMILNFTIFEINWLNGYHEEQPDENKGHWVFVPRETTG